MDKFVVRTPAKEFCGDPKARTQETPMKHAPTGKNGSTSGPTTATTPAANPAAGPAATMGGWLHAAAAVKPTATASALAGKDAEILKLKDDIATLKRLNTYTAKKAPPAKNKAGPGKKTPKKKAPKKKKLAALVCPAELITAHGNGSLYAVLNAMNTLELKCFCEECKVPRSGAKYKILALLLAHVEKAAFAAGHNGDSKAGALTLEFAQLSFARAHTKFCKLTAALEKGKVPPAERWATVVAAARGFDQVIYTAITGPNRKQYNGSRGETGIEANADVGRAVCTAFVCAAGVMDDGEFGTAIDDVIMGATKCTPYGFETYGDDGLKEGVVAAKQEGVFDLLPEERKMKIEELVGRRRF